MPKFDSSSVLLRHSFFGWWWSANNKPLLVGQSVGRSYKYLCPVSVHFNKPPIWLINDSWQLLGSLLYSLGLPPKFGICISSVRCLVHHCCCSRPLERMLIIISSHSLCQAHNAIKCTEENKQARPPPQTIVCSHWLAVGASSYTRGAPK